MSKKDPEQLPLFDPPKAKAPRPSPTGRRRRAAPSKTSQLALPLQTPPSLRVVRGEGRGTGHRRGRLVSLPTLGEEVSLPTRGELTLALLQAGADLVAGRISVEGATAIREAAEEALRRLEQSERDPHSQPQFVRAARALRELCR